MSTRDTDTSERETGPDHHDPAARPERRRPTIRVLALPGRRFPQNPYMRLFCDAFAGTEVAVVDIKSRRGAMFGFDIIHVHFPEHYVSAQTLPRALFWVTFYCTYFLVAKLLGKRIVWMVHNVLPFQNRHPWLLGPWMRLFRHLADAHVFLSRSSRAEFARRFPHLAGKPACVVPHGAYAVPPADAAKRAGWRARVAPAEPTYLVGFLGGIKRYKNIGALTALPARLADGRRIHAVVAGTPDGESRGDLDAVAQQLGDRVTIVPERIGDADLNDLIGAMDVVFLPYRKGWNSGFAILVLGNRARLLTSDLPMFRELAEDVGRTWLTICADTDAVPAALEAVVSRSVEPADDRRLDAFLRATTCESGGRRLAQFYQDCLAAPPGRLPT